MKSVTVEKLEHARFQTLVGCTDLGEDTFVRITLDDKTEFLLLYQEGELLLQKIGANRELHINPQRKDLVKIS